LTKININT